MFFAYEVFDGQDGYGLFIHKDKDHVNDQAQLDIDFDNDHYTMGTIQAKSIDHALQQMADDNWLYEEYNK